MAELLPAAAYNLYRNQPAGRATAENRPPLNASPGELRLWQKLHGELDAGKATEEARIRARNCGMRQQMPTPDLAGEMVKNGRRSVALRSSSAADVTRASSVPRRRTQERGGLLEEQLRNTIAQMAIDLKTARAEAEKERDAASALQEEMRRAAKAEKERTEAMGARLEEVMQAWQAQQREWAHAKMELEAERDAALGRPPEEPSARAGAAVEPLAAALTAAGVVESAAAVVEEAAEAETEAAEHEESQNEVYSEDDLEEEEDALEASLP